METMFWIWMAVALVFLIIEIGVPGLIFICFAVGAVGAAMYAEMSPQEYVIQTGIFAVIALALIPFSRKFAKKISVSSPMESNVDALIGQPGIVVKAIDLAEYTGQVRLQGEVWSARAEENIPEGAKVTVMSVEGNHLHVKRGFEQVEQTKSDEGIE
ncbi:NfeD family protein [bacterium AH-315-F03]|nr:NfeD family protein [bacterium AH-315-F03]